MQTRGRPLGGRRLIERAFMSTATARLKLVEKQFMTAPPRKVSAAKASAKGPIGIGYGVIAPNEETRLIK